MLRKKLKEIRALKLPDALRTEAFNLLKPYCVQLTKEHTRPNISRLFGALQSINIVFLQDLQEYVVFPLRVILKHPKRQSQDLYLDLFTCMEYVLGHTKITRWDFFQDIFNTATTMLSCPTDQSKVAKLSEELKIAIIQTLRTLVKNSEYSVLQHLYTVMFLPLLGHAVSLLLNIAEVEKARNVKILAMECLLDLSQADAKYSQCIKADIGGIYASFLPGISVTLCKIITGDTKQGFAVISKAIYVWTRVVNLVLDDKLLEISRQKHAKQEQNNSKECDPRLQGLIVNRDKKWVDDTSGNLYILVKQVSTVRTHRSWRVRLGLVECAEHLLMHCSNSMQECVPVFLEILVSLIADDFTKVSTGSRHALDLFSQSQAPDQQRKLIEVVETNLYNLTTTLPRQIQTANDFTKVSTGSRHALDLFSQSQAPDQQRKLIEVVETNLYNLTTTLPRLVSLIADDFTKVSTGSRHALDLFSQSQAPDRQRKLIEVVETNLYNLTTTLPRQIQTAMDEDKILLLNLLSGYITILGTRIKSVLLCAPHLKRLSTCLVQTLELECNDVKIVEERTSFTGHGASVLQGNISSIIRPRKYFKHFTTQHLFTKLQHICRVLGYYGDINLLVDHFLDMCHDSSMFKMQATLIINELMLGTTGEYVDLGSTKNGKKWHQHSRDELDIVVRMLVDEYLNPVNFDLMTSTKSTKEGERSIEERLQSLTSPQGAERNSLTVARINRNIVQLSLFLEGIGNFAKIMKSDFVPLLMKVLYPLLEKLGDETAYISSSAFLSLMDICEGCGYKCIDQLIRSNTDYLMNSITQKLRHFTMNKNCPLVLKVMLQYSSAELLPLIDDTIQEILESLDDNYEEDAILFMGVLNELSKAVVRWFPDKKDSNQGDDELSREPDSKLFSDTDPTKQASIDNDPVSDSFSESQTSTDDCVKSQTDSEQLPDILNDLGSLKDKNIQPISTTDVTTDANDILQDNSTNEEVLNSDSLENTNAKKNENETSMNSEKDNLKPTSDDSEYKCHSNPADSLNESVSENKTLSEESKGAADSGNTSGNNCDSEDVCLEALNDSKTKDDGSLTMEKCSRLNSIEELTEFFRKFLELNRQAEEDINVEEIDDSIPDNHTEDITDPDETPPVPKHVSAVKEVILRCKHIISSNNPRLRLLVLDTLAQSCTALKHHQNELLNLIHQIWPPYSLRFNDEEKLVIIKAIDVLQVIVECAGDFVKFRIVKDVLPKLTNFLNSQSYISSCAGQAYQFTVNYKLQLAILKSVGNIAEMSKIDGDSLDQLTSVCVLYLHSKQPTPLQQACLECCKTLTNLNEDLMWLKLNYLYCPEGCLSPDNRFKQVKGLQNASQNNPYTTNVTKLMKETGLLKQH